MKIELKKALQNDLDLLLRLRMETMHRLFVEVGILLTKQQHKARINFRFDCAWLIFSSAQKCGMIKYVEEESHIHIMQFQLLPKFQGQGIGTKVLEHVCAIARTADKKVQLKVLKNSPAIAFYKNAGFKIYDSDDLEYHMESD